MSNTTKKLKKTIFSIKPMFQVQNIGLKKSWIFLLFQLNPDRFVIPLSHPKHCSLSPQTDFQSSTFADHNSLGVPIGPSSFSLSGFCWNVQKSLPLPLYFVPSNSAIYVHWILFHFSISASSCVSIRYLWFSFFNWWLVCVLSRLEFELSCD